MRAIMIMFDSLRRDLLPCYGGLQDLPAFRRLAEHTAVFDRAYVGSLPCMPARREIHTGRLNMLHRSWGPLEPFDDSMPELLDRAGIHTHITTDHYHYVQDGGATYMERYSSWECFRGQEDDKWKGYAGGHDTEFPPYVFGTDGLREPLRTKRARGGWQNAVNRTHRSGEADYPQTRTFDAGLAFIHENRSFDNWFLTIEPFDPHEPFDAPEDYETGLFDPDRRFLPDWPPYAKVKESDEFVENVRKKYIAMLRFCDHSLQRVLDAMDEWNLWDDTMLIVNTDHGFLLGEHSRWSKGFMPDYQELVNIPLMIWDPRSRVCGVHRSTLVQTIDLAPTLLDYFGVPIPEDMQGVPLKDAVERDAPVHTSVMFGFFGGWMNITDGRYKLMRAVRDKDAGMFEYTLMPTHMAARFSMQEMRSAELAAPFAFTKGAPVLKIRPDRIVFLDEMDGDYLYDLEMDPSENHPMENAGVQKRLSQEAVEWMRRLDAPREVYVRYGFEPEGMEK